MTAQSSNVTIVITVYNEAAYIAEAIKSAVEQTVACHVVVVDDGSTDGSAELAEAFGVEVVRLPHRGALETFRAAVDEVTTPFYCLLNGDDALESAYVASTLPLMDDPHVGFVYTGVRHVGAASAMLPGRPFNPGALRWGNYIHAASLVRKAAYDAIGGFDAAFSDHLEDWALWVAMVEGGWLGKAVEQPLLRYRKHVGQSRNPSARHAMEDARWRIARRHPRFYGPLGLARLVASSVKLRLTGT